MTTVKAILASIPYLRPHALRLLPATDGSVRVRQPFRGEVTNIVGTMHAGALFTLAETAAGVAAFNVAPDRRPMVFLRSVTARYLRRVSADVTAVGRVGAEAAERARATLAAAGRADVAVTVRIEEDDGAVAFEGEFDYAMRAERL